jgi:hypothetical protein
MAGTRFQTTEKEEFNPLPKFKEYADFEATGKKSSVTVTESLHDRDEKRLHGKERLRDARDLVTEILLVEDDPSLNPWTFRMWFLGIGMSIFAG